LDSNSLLKITTGSGKLNNNGNFFPAKSPSKSSWKKRENSKEDSIIP
jgi:hypothetical protein